MSDVFLRAAIQEVIEELEGRRGFMTHSDFRGWLYRILDKADKKDEAVERQHDKIINEIGQF